MSLRDTYSNFSYVIALETQNYTPAAVLSGAQIDTQGFEAVTFVFTIGNHASVSTASYIDLILQHGPTESALGASNWSDVPASQMIHSVYAKTSTTSTGLVKRLNDSGTGSTTYVVGYQGSARYLRVQVSANAATESGLVACTAILGYPANWPVNNPAKE